MPGQTIKVKHNIEMAHRLFLTPGKCQNIHGHSWWITLEIAGEVDDAGLLDGFNFTSLKRKFRAHLDITYDHRLLLNSDDPWANLRLHDNPEEMVELPGLAVFTGEDPTTENLASTIGVWASVEFSKSVSVEVWETSVNNATWSNIA